MLQTKLQSVRDMTRSSLSPAPLCPTILAFPGVMPHEESPGTLSTVSSMSGVPQSQNGWSSALKTPLVCNDGLVWPDYINQLIDDSRAGIIEDGVSSSDFDSEENIFVGLPHVHFAAAR
jgi:hypothetical protein